LDVWASAPTAKRKVSRCECGRDKLRPLLSGRCALGNCNLAGNSRVHAVGGQGQRGMPKYLTSFLSSTLPRLLCSNVSHLLVCSARMFHTSSSALLECSTLPRLLWSNAPFPSILRQSRCVLSGPPWSRSALIWIDALFDTKCCTLGLKDVLVRLQSSQVCM
jgi:hypothetical protein